MHTATDGRNGLFAPLLSRLRFAAIRGDLLISDTRVHVYATPPPPPVLDSRRLGPRPRSGCGYGAQCVQWTKLDNIFRYCRFRVSQCIPLTSLCSVAILPIRAVDNVSFNLPLQNHRKNENGVSQISQKLLSSRRRGRVYSHSSYVDFSQSTSSAAFIAKTPLPSRVRPNTHLVVMCTAS